MKRILAFLLALVMMLSLCASFGSLTALADEEADHEHDWAKATCTEPKTCKICGATEGEPKGHKVEEWKTTRKATCTATGTKTGVCERCGETVSKTIKAKGHKAGDKWKTIQEPTSSDRTLIRVKRCERCGAVCKRQEKKLTNSEYRSWYKDHCSTISFKKLERNPDKYEGRRIKVSGYVLQVLENSYYGTKITTLRVATKGHYENVVLVTIYNRSSSRILEDDKITVWGEYDGIETRETIWGKTVYIPAITAEYYSVK